MKDKYEKDVVAIVFPQIIDLLKGSDTNIEIIKSSELQSLKLPVKPPIAKQKIAYIFCTPQLQRDDLKPILNVDAEDSALQYKELFEQILLYDDV